MRQFRAMLTVDFNFRFTIWNRDVTKTIESQLNHLQREEKQRPACVNFLFV